MSKTINDNDDYFNKVCKFVPKEKDDVFNDDLIDACLRKDESTAIEFAKEIIDGKDSIKRGIYEALLISCEKNLPDAALILIEACEFDPDYKQNKNNDPLLHACDNKMEKVAVALLDKEIYDSKLDNKGHIALVACKKEMDTVVSKMVEKDFFDFNYLDENKENIFIIACKKRMVDVAKELANLDSFNEKSCIDKDGNTALMIACMKRLSKVATKIISKHPTEKYLQMINKDKEDAFLLACKHSLSDIAIYIFENNGVNLGLVSKSGKNAIQIACENGLSRVLVKLNAPPKEKLHNTKQTSVGQYMRNFLNNSQPVRSDAENVDQHQERINKLIDDGFFDDNEPIRPNDFTDQITDDDFIVEPYQFDVQQKCKDIILLDNKRIEDFLLESNDNIVFSFMGKNGIIYENIGIDKNLIELKDELVLLACKRPTPYSSFEYSKEQYYNLQTLTGYGHARLGIVKYILRILNRPNQNPNDFSKRIFVFKETDIKIDRTISHTKKRNCREGTDITLYKLFKNIIMENSSYNVEEPYDTHEAYEQSESDGNFINILYNKPRLAAIQDLNKLLRDSQNEDNILYDTFVNKYDEQTKSFLNQFSNFEDFENELKKISSELQELYEQESEGNTHYSEEVDTEIDEQTLEEILESKDVNSVISYLDNLISNINQYFEEDDFLEQLDEPIKRFFSTHNNNKTEIIENLEQLLEKYKQTLPVVMEDETIDEENEETNNRYSEQAAEEFNTFLQTKDPNQNRHIDYLLRLLNDEKDRTEYTIFIDKFENDIEKKYFGSFSNYEEAIGNLTSIKENISVRGGKKTKRKNKHTKRTNRKYKKHSKSNKCVKGKHTKKHTTQK